MDNKQKCLCVIALLLALIAIGSSDSINNNIFYNNSTCTSCINETQLQSNMSLKVNKSGDDMTGKLSIAISGSNPGLAINRSASSTSEDDLSINRNNYWSYIRSTVSSNTAGQYPLFLFQKSAGSYTSPSSVSNGHVLGSFNWYGYNNGYQQAALFGAVVDGVVSGGSAKPPTSIYLSTAIGTTAGSIERVRINNSGKLLYYNATNRAESSALCYNSSTGEITFNSGLTTCLASTENVKTNITTIVSQKEKVMALEPISYSTKDSAVNYGFSAENVSKVYPELVGYDTLYDVILVNDGDEKEPHYREVKINPRKGNITGVKYENMIAVLTKVVQEQQATINKICSKNQTLCK